MQYERAQQLMKSARNGHDKPLQNNTRLVSHHDGYAIRLHSTDVVLIREDGTYVLDSGGWPTLTTKDRINGYSPARVYSERGTWYVDAERSDADPEPFPGISPWHLSPANKREWNKWMRRNRVEFFDGMVVGASGRVAPVDPGAQLKAAREWCRRHGLRPRGGQVTLWKAVGADFVSHHGATYAPRTKVTAKDYAPSAHCGSGLHFGPTASVAAGYANHEGGNVLLKCRVPLATLIPLEEKCKADSCYVIGRFRTHALTEEWSA